MHGVAAEPIVAVATPRGRGGVGMVRISGPELKGWLRHLADRPVLPRQAVHARFIDADGNAIDDGVLLYFPAPGSFTGEDVIELQGHGNPVILDMLVRRAIELGARPARPGEFSERAFLNGKLDLVQAEAIADLVAAESEAAVRGALRSLQGEFSRQVHAIAGQLVDVRVLVEAGLDFSDQDLEFTTTGQLRDRLLGLGDEVDELIEQARAGARLQEGFHVVIAGRPNAGKSSLLNALSGRDSAIVTAIPGTTRDLVRDTITLEGMSFHLADTAGFRNSTDPIELEGMRRAREEAMHADLVLLVVESLGNWQEDVDQLLNGEFAAAVAEGRLLLVLNKIDLSGITAGAHDRSPLTIAVSTVSGAGMAVLRATLFQIGHPRLGTEGQFMARRRHLVALAETRMRVQTALAMVGGYPAELIAEELRLAQREVDSITGAFTSDDLLGAIFSEFCVGK